MTAVTETWRRVGVNQELKKVVIKVAATTGTGETVDMGTDATDGKGVVLEAITDAYHIGLTGTRVDASWSNTTGIVTLGTISGAPAVVFVVVEGY